MKQVKISMKKSGIKECNLIFYLFFVANINSFAQKITEARYCYYISNVEYEIIQLNIRNDTNENMLLWFEKDTAVQKKSIEEKVRNYFFKRKGYFSIINVISEYGSTLDFEECGPDIFIYFYKKIEPQKAFLIQVICKKPYDKNTLISFKNMITTVIPSQLEKAISSQLEKAKFNIFQMPGWEKPSFRFNTLVIDGQNICIH